MPMAFALEEAREVRVQMLDDICDPSVEVAVI